MTNAESLARLVRVLDGTPTGTSNKDLLADVVVALGGTPSPGDTNDELIGKIADYALGPSGLGSEWILFDDRPLAGSDGKALYDVYFEIQVGTDAWVSGMVPKGELMPDDLVAGGVIGDGVTVATISPSNWRGVVTHIPVAGDPPVAGGVSETDFAPFMCENLWVYFRDSKGLPE
ncbi:MAG: hypothetical protein IKQ60_06495 [Candidatus Methanomethylophilaceae archaeon]|nr:hypothetical protein [Candidatus Methanomethylophilaceae archaeon]